MIRQFEFRDLDKIMNIWLEGNLEAHSFIDAEYWKKNFESVKSVLPNAEVYVYEFFWGGGFRDSLEWMRNTLPEFL